MTTKPGKGPLSYTGIKESNPPQIYFSSRDPTGADFKRYDLGDIWIREDTDHAFMLVDKTANVATWIELGDTTPPVSTLTGDAGGAVAPDGADNINILGNSVGFQNGIQFTGTPASNTLTGKDLRNVTVYVVDANAGETEYATIQSAIDAANAAGVDADVYVRPGSYTESLTLYDGINIVGTSLTSCIITGVHTPPASGDIQFHNMTLTSATHIFNSAAAGSTNITLSYCTTTCTNGYLFNLLNWTGDLILYQTGSAGTNDGFVNNTGGSDIFAHSCRLGFGTGNAFVSSGGTVEIYATEIVCPGTFGGASTVTISMGSLINGTITTAGTTSATISETSFSTGATAAISHGSANSLTLSNVTIDSSNDPAIDGAGGGNIEIGSITFLDNSNVNGALTLNYTSEFESGTAYLQNISFDRGTNLVDADGELIIGATGSNPQIATLTAGAGINITNGAGSITISTVGSGGFTWNEITAASANMSADNGYIANRGTLVTLTLPATASIGDTVQVAGKGAGGWRIAQNAGQTIHFANNDTTAGAGGRLDSTGQYDVVELVCITANTDWIVTDSVGAITIT